MSSLLLRPAITPADAEMPQTPQELVNFIAGYLLPLGFDSITGVIISSTTPSADERDSLWLETNLNGNAVRLKAYQEGEWRAVPLVAPSGETPPAGAVAGQLWFNTETLALQMYDGNDWTSNLYPEGPTSDRPASPPDDYLYFDTTIKRLLRYTSSGWTTFDGAIGELRMFASVDEATVLAQNPGWSVYDPMAGRFPLGRNDDHPLDSEGGTDGIFVGMSGHTVGPRGTASGAGAIITATIGAAGGGDSIEYVAPGDNTVSNISDTFDFLPRFHAVLYLRKEF